MSTVSKLNKRGLLLPAVIFCLIAVFAVSAFAGSKSAVSRTAYAGETHTGMCCKSWDPSVTVVEPDKPVPIVVTFSTDYRANASFMVALRINGGPCTFFGPYSAPAYTPTDYTYTSRTFQWVIMPGDYKLVTGPNVITVCGGGTNSADDTIELGFNTLSAELAK